MNRRGQTLVAFVIIVPVFVLLLAFVVDTGYLLKEATKLNSTTKTIIRTTYQDKNELNYDERVMKLYEENGIPFDNVEVIVRDNELKITNHYSIESIFGQIIGLKEYEIKLTLKGQKINGKLTISKE